MKLLKFNFLYMSDHGHDDHHDSHGHDDHGHSGGNSGSGAMDNCMGIVDGALSCFFPFMK